MAAIDVQEMLRYLSLSVTSSATTRVNRNKITGMLAEVAFREHITGCGFADQVSPGGWIVRSKGPGIFGHETVVFFPEVVLPDCDYPPGREPTPTQALHTICATFHQLGIRSYFCAATISTPNLARSLTWQCTQLGVPATKGYQPFPQSIQGFTPRTRNYNWLRYDTDTSTIPQTAVAEEFSKEHVRVSFFDAFQAEVSDVDGVFWGQNRTYPVEIKEKTPGSSKDLGEYFGLDVGPFVKLAYFAAKRGMMHSLFVVHEIVDESTRAHRDWWYITFDRLAEFASWNQRGGGQSMGGGRSAVVRIPKSEFSRLDHAALGSL